MAAELVATLPPTLAGQPKPGPWIRLLVRRRVPISIGLFTSLVLVDMLVIENRPRDVLGLTDPLVALSQLLIVAGLVLRSWAAGTLRKQKQLASTGPYAWIRNPLYAGSFLMMVGFGTLVHDPLTLWIVAGPVAWLYWHTVRSEERYLATFFPSEWPAYAASVPRFIPRTVRWPCIEHWSLAQWLKNEEYQAWLGAAAALVGIKAWELWV